MGRDSLQTMFIIGVLVTMSRPACCTVGRDRTRANDTAAETLLHHLLGCCDVRVHQAKHVEPHFVLDESAAHGVELGTASLMARRVRTQACIRAEV